MKDITDINVRITLANYIKSGQTIVVDFYAPWCAPCRALAPVLEKLTGVIVLKINGDNADDAVQAQVNSIMTQFQVTAYPTIIIFKDGEFVKKIVGANINAIKAAL